VRGNWDESAFVPPQQLDSDTILRTLIEHDVEFVVIGGPVVAAHGFARGTKDVDIVPAPDAGNRSRLHTAVVTLDAEPLEIGDRPEELPVSFTPDGLDEGGNWASSISYAAAAFKLQATWLRFCSSTMHTD
jgi:hypothetical protein